MLKAMFDRSRMPGRDAFLELLRRRKLLSHRPRPRCTTKSNHHYRKWKNLIKGMIPDAANQLWVSDITYIDTDAGNTYLHLVTDAYSKKIVGWRLSQTLEAENTLAALRMAIRQSGMSDLSGLTHHSDRGANIAATPMWKSCSCTISQ